MSITISKHLLEIGRQLDKYNVPNDGREVTITQAQYDSLKEELNMLFVSSCGCCCCKMLRESKLIKPRFDRFTINIEG